MNRLTKEEKAAGKLSHLIATAVGCNELAKRAKVFGERVYWRLLRDTILKGARGLGHTDTFTETEEGLLVIEVPGGLHFNFYPRDIEQMRECVAAWDARKAETDAGERGER